MGAYFSLRGAGEWDQTVSESMEPSIWTNVSFTPMNRSQKMLLHRGGEVQFSFPEGIVQSGDIIALSDAVDMSLLIGFQESAGRLYSALLIHAPLPEQPHVYSRAVEEVILKAPTSQPAASKSPTKASTRSGGDEMFSGGSLAQLDSEAPPASSTDWPYALLYTVKEGVMVYFSSDYESCEQVVREIAEHEFKASSRESKDKCSEVKCVNFPAGRAPPPVGRVFHEMLGNELKREFAIRCEAQEQAGCTNCVVFCLRMLLGMKMSVRGHDIEAVCEGRRDLGPKVGKAAGDAWEQLFRRVRI
mmetsp:Transcript_44604/g.127947  ORF Transcript_44604/g.127947 Transcript_44604/m.127947 type:complete len:302 (-) Transcript_44604:80-985(-)|eukprot:CAMPEP_0177346498 /NCGR_PEP_ID=MMETSP0368-20130122/29219_1 /TAXON_ID=447022 ORGANISM="Scrippsiella hangoei-like, Strain SHHI-4" /NCGR_SAMPLE_ID=MMETSP0368 /ASSEMBLY_ACC=CAM_ASM_000363 /LENGTH=301 /DNA_ID=CAMNT_0018808157 /DNA_START=55 /DNA_END=960 /DNA_ORIENTATION=+